MKKIVKIIAVFLFSFFVMCSYASCVFNAKSNKEEVFMIPQNNIRYTHFEAGNVISKGQRAIFLVFTSDYVVSKIEITGVLLDEAGSPIYSFDTEMSYNSPSENPELPILLDANLVENVKSASFTKIQAYTAQEIDFNN